MPDRSNLSELYPKAKTFAEQQADKERLEKVRLARRPKHLALRMSGLASLLLLCVIGGVRLTEFSMGLSIIIGVYGAFATILIVYGIGWLVVHDMIRIYELYAIDIRVILLVYGVVDIVGVIWLYLLTHFSWLGIIGGVAILFVVTWIVFSLMSRAGHVPDKKIG